MDTPSWLPTNPLVAHPLPLLDMPNALSFFHYPFQNKILFVWSCYKPFPFIWMDKALGFLITYLSSMHQVVSAIYHPFWAKCHPSKAFSQKRSWLEIENGVFSPSTKPHPLNPLTMSPLFLYWLGTSWWCSDYYVFALQPSIFVFFYSHAISIVIG